MLAYGALVAYTYCLYGLGPILTFLREELHLSYTLTSLHSGLWAAGTVTTGLVFAPALRLLGRHRLFWLTAGGTAGGALLMMAAHALPFTLLAAAWLGTSGTLLQTGSISLLSERHGERRDRALVEATIGGSAAAVLAPLLFGLAQRTSIGWRAALLVPVVALCVLCVVFRRLELPTATSAAPTSSRLPGAFWRLAALVAAVVGLEFSLVFYAPQLLRAQAGLPTAQAATALSLFYVGELLGRIGGGGLTRRPGRAVPLTLAALGLTSAGFLALWLSGQAALAISGLLVAGLGVANLYPLTLALALGAAAGQTDRANARVQLLVGMAVIGAPLALGALADRAGVARAFALVPAIIGLALVLLLAGHRSRRAVPEPPARR